MGIPGVRSVRFRVDCARLTHQRDMVIAPWEPGPRYEAQYSGGAESHLPTYLLGRIHVHARYPHPLHTCSSDAPAFCSLYSKAASSPMGLCWAEIVCCSYSTHRLLSESPAASDPKETCVDRKAYQKARILTASVMWFLPNPTHLWASASGWAHAHPNSWLSWWKGSG